MPVGDTRKLPRGTSYRFNIVYTQNGVARTLAGATIRFTIKSVRYDADADDSAAEFTADITVHDDAAGGLSHVSLLPVDTATITPGSYFYDIKVAEAGGAIYLIEEGEMLITGSPTNRLS